MYSLRVVLIVYSREYYYEKNILFHHIGSISVKNFFKKLFSYTQSLTMRNLETYYMYMNVTVMLIFLYFFHLVLLNNVPF